MLPVKRLARGYLLVYKMKSPFIFVALIFVVGFTEVVNCHVLRNVDSNIIREQNVGPLGSKGEPLDIYHEDHASSQEKIVREGMSCLNRHKRIYTENFLLDNDQAQSQVMATMQITMSDPYHVTCVEVISRDDSSPQVLQGGYGGNYTEVGVELPYGVGYDFTVHLYGYYGREPTYPGQPLMIDHMQRDPSKRLPGV